MNRYANGWSRRKFVSGLTLAGAVGLLGLPPDPGAAEPPPETTRLRMVQIPSICQSPQYIAAELLRSEGSTPSAPSPHCHMVDGATSMRRTRFASMRCGCTRRG
jgi:hypothetical protein